MLRRVREAEAEIRRISATGLPGGERRRAKEAAIGALLRAVEQQTATAINKVVKQLDRLQKAHTESRKSADPTVELLRLERTKLRYAQADDKQAVGKIKGMYRKGYSEEELLVLESKGEEAADDAAESEPEGAAVKG